MGRTHAISRRRFLAGLGAAAAASVLGVPRARAVAPRSALGFHLPAEWHRHERTLISWPYRPDLYLQQLDDIQLEFAAVARAIAKFEPVLVIANPGTKRRVRKLCGRDVHVEEFPIDDAWIRDNGPIFVVGEGGATGVDFGFNAWGEKFAPWDQDDALPGPLCDFLGIPSKPVGMILEGGAIQWDGHGTIITTEQCLLNPNRNPGMTKADIETTLKASLGVRKIVWIPWGLLDDWITDGHVDGVCIYLAPGRVVVQTDREHPAERKRLNENIAALNAATDARGKSIEIVKFPLLPKVDVAGPQKLSHCYINFYLTNGGVVVPLAGLRHEDAEAMERIRDLFPRRRVVGVRTPAMTWAGGGVHCITQPVPAVPGV